MRRLFILRFIVLSVYVVLKASDTRYLTLDVKQLNESYKLFADGDKDSHDYVDELIKTSEEIIRSDRRYTIVDKKADTPSGDKHDYISMGPYWWPNPDTPDGLPYIRKDGEVNPESREDYTDQAVISETNKDVFNLAMTYFFTKDDKYVVKASEILRTFYVDEKTRMNPNLKYAQFVPGMNEGRCFGIIESSSLVKMMEAVSLCLIRLNGHPICIISWFIGSLPIWTGLLTAKTVRKNVTQRTIMVRTTTYSVCLCICFVDARPRLLNI